jgi:hypothetical protein
MGKNETDYGLDHYTDFVNEKLEQINITEIVVPTYRDKEQLLKAFHYLHDNCLLDIGYCAINTIAHIHIKPNLIRVQNVN